MGLLTSKVATFGDFTLYADSIKSRAKHGGTFPLTDVKASIEEGEALRQRVTATRLVAIGIFAFAIKKKKGGTWYLTVESPEFFWTSEVGRKDQRDAHEFVARVNNQVRVAAKASADAAEAAARRAERQERRQAKRDAKADAAH